MGIENWNSEDWRNAAGIALTPVTGGLSLAGTTWAEDAWNDFTGKTAIEEQNKANAAEAQKNRDWMEKMSNTAYQRAAKDLAAAGINPTAASSLGGASTPSSTPATMMAKPSGADTTMKIASAASTAASTIKTLQEAKFISPKAKADIANTAANTIKAQSETQNINAKTDMLKAEYTIMAQEDKIRQATLYNRYMAAINAGASEQTIQEITNEWLNTEFGKKARKVGLTIEQIGPLVQQAVQAYGVYQQGRNLYQQGFAAGYRNY